MNSIPLSRRSALRKTGVLAGAAAFLGRQAVHSAAAKPTATMAQKPFIYCLNTATIRGQKLGLVQEIEITAKAGYNAIEPWIDSIEAYIKGGGKLADLRKRLSDLGLTVEGVIGFPEWIVDDPARRAKGLERAKHELDLASQIGAKRLAAPPSGATDPAGLNLLHAAERYRALLDLAKSFGMIAQLELWGFSKNLNRLGECLCVAVEAAHPNACVLADVYHIYKGGSDFHGLRMAGRDVIQVLHMNDYPDNPPREAINDSQRVMPGDGVAPIVELLQTLHATGGQKVLSLEIFNQSYWNQDAALTAKTGLEKMKALAKRAVPGA